MSDNSKRQSMALVPTSFAEVQQMSQVWAKSALVATAYRGRPEDVALVVATGMELGLLPLASLRMISVVEGKPSLSADCLVAIVKARRDVCEYFVRVEEETNDEQAVYETKRVGDPKPQRMKFTMKQAEAMGLSGRDNWKKQKGTMLRHRCKSALARDVYSDVVGAVYSDDEAIDIRQGTARPSASVAQFRAPAESAVIIDAEVVEDEAKRLLNLIMVAESEHALNDIAAEIKRQPDAVKRELKPHWTAKREQLRAVEDIAEAAQ